MNWSKAKTILIIALLITNAILAIVLFSQDNQEVSTIKESFITDVVNILKEKDISIAVDIPNEIPSLNTLTVKYEMLESFDINKRFFDGQGLINKFDEDKIIISRENESITIENNKKMIYKNKRESKGYENLDKDTAEQIVMKFLKDRSYDTSGMILWRNEIDEDLNTYNIEFSMLYKEKYLENTYTKAVIDREGVLELKRLWLDPISEGETPIYINTAPKALLDLIGNEDLYGKTINNISLCYYFDPKKDDYIEDPEETKEGKSIPAWRVTFEDGSKIIIDNY